MSAARRLFRSSLNINSQSYVTWMTWASLEEEQGNSIRAEEIRNLYFQQVSGPMIQINPFSSSAITRSNFFSNISGLLHFVRTDLI